MLYFICFQFSYEQKSGSREALPLSCLCLARLILPVLNKAPCHFIPFPKDNSQSKKQSDYKCDRKIIAYHALRQLCQERLRALLAALAVGSLL